MEKRFYVYVHKRPTDGTIFYVGKGCRNRLTSTKSRSKYWHNTVAKHGGFVPEKIYTGLTEAEAFSLEIATIAEIGIENLCNLSTGGDGPSGCTRSEETKRVLSERTKQQFSDPEFLEAHKAREKEKWKSEDTRKKQSSIVAEAMSSEEVRLRISEGVKKAWLNSGYREARSAWWNDAEKQKHVSLNMSKGQQRRFANPEEVEKHKERQKKLSKPVFCITNQTMYESQNAAAKDLGILQGGISQCVKGKIKSYKGYQFR